MIACARCDASLPWMTLNTPNLTACPSCGSELSATAFPAVFNGEHKTAPAKDVTTDQEASCFYHSSKTAETACEGCGRFLCALCDLEFNGKHFCPACVESGNEKDQLPSLENRRILHDRIAFALSVYTLTIFPVTLIAAPAALFLVIRYWNAPRSLVRPGRARQISAALFAVAEIIVWGLIFFT